MDAPLERLTIERLILPPLSPYTIAAAVARCRATWPHATATMKVGSGFFIGDDDTSGRFDQDDYTRYVAKWEKWADGLPAFVEELHKRIAGRTRLAGADLWYENAGAATAERLTIDFAVWEGWQVLADQRAVDEMAPPPILLPKRPLTPFQQDHHERATKADDVTRRFRHLVAPPVRPRDPTGFYWIERPGHHSMRGVFGCDEFRAKRRNEDVIWLWPRGNPPGEGELRVDIHGSSLSEPLNLRLPLAFADHEAGWGEEAVVALLDPPVAELLAEAAAGIEAA